MPENDFNLTRALNCWWRRQRQEVGWLHAFTRLNAVLFEFLRDSLPGRSRRRYGDIDFDWEHRVDTTSGTVSWRTRLLGLLSSPYQPIPAEEFREIMNALAIDFTQFTFIDVGSGKGRALMLACGFGFRRIIGIELLQELHRIAQENLRKFERKGTVCNIELLCEDATRFTFPAEPTVVFLFNPLPQSSLAILLENIAASLCQLPRALYVAYANPVHETLLAQSQVLRKTVGNLKYCVFRSKAS